MGSSQQIEDVLAPFIHLAQVFRSGDNHSIDRALSACNLILTKYLTTFQDKKTLTTLLASINTAYKKRDFVGLADIYEYEMTAYLKAEIENFSKNASL